ncbi:uncharacterized protein LOC144882071 [Branchiostoma floridae x Branchiostoma japonicum]
MDPAMADMVKMLIEACYGEYGAKYSKTEKGLRQLLQTKYNGNIEEFRECFFNKTIQLLKCLQSKGFPVSTSKYQLLHLVSPGVQDQPGDMFFQVGHSTPGSLSLKFTKYDDIVRNVVKLQNSHVPKEDYEEAFTAPYLKNLRTRASECGNIGDMLMRTCIVITRDGAVTRVGTSAVMEKMRVNVISDMTPEQKNALAEKLDMEPVLRAPNGHDNWLALAERLEAEGTLDEGCAAEMNADFATDMRSATKLLLEKVKRENPRYPTARLLDHLRQMRRNDAIEAFNHASETLRRRRNNFQGKQARTVDLGELARGLSNTKLSMEESGLDSCLPDTAERLRSDAQENLADDKAPSFLSQPSPHGVLQRSQTVPTPHEQQPTSVPVQPVSDDTTHTPQLVSQPHQEQVSEPVTVDLHGNETAPNDLQATPEYPPSNVLPDNPGYPEVEAAIANSQGTSPDAQPIAADENPTAKLPQNCELENNPCYPTACEAVTGPLETGNLNSNDVAGLVGQAATLTNQEYPSVKRAVQSN